MPNIFWNPDQKRIRAFWRLLLQTLLTVILSTILTLVFLGVMNIGGSLGLFSLPANQTLTPEGMSALMASDRVLFLLSEIISFVPTLIGIALAVRWFDKRRFADLGLHFSRRWWIDFAFGLGLGAFLMTIIFLVEVAAGWVEITGAFVSANHPFGVSILAGFFGFIMVGITEELMSRGYHLINLIEGLETPRLDRRLVVVAAYLLSAVIFSLLHLGNPNMTIVSTINLMLAGLFLGVGMLLTGELAIGIGLHITWNFFQGMVFGFPVSGLDPGTTFIAIRQGGPQAWTGGVFGPEAGLLGICAILAGVAITIAWVKATHGVLVCHLCRLERLSAAPARGAGREQVTGRIVSGMEPSAETPEG